MKFKSNARNKANGWALLRSLEDECARLVILDPQYRAVLDKLKFGNEGDSRQNKRADLPQMTDHDISMFIEQIERVLKPSAYLALWVDKYAIGSGHHLKYLRYTMWLRTVDLLCWETQRFGMGRRFRCATEYLLILQKEPVRAKGTWSDHSIRDWWSEKNGREKHPHAKPAGLTERLILATTKPGDLIVDPCAGSYGVLDICKATKREFIGSDLI
jgi:site-specific DNA-methyltransferase (adenine-specific)